jgi:hypothetical protein
MRSQKFRHILASYGITNLPATAHPHADGNLFRAKIAHQGQTPYNLTRRYGRGWSVERGHMMRIVRSVGITDWVIFGGPIESRRVNKDSRSFVRTNSGAAMIGV